MASAFGTVPADLWAAIGPSVGPADYEVDAPVIDALRSAFGADAERLLEPGRTGHARLDLWTANRLQLEAAGLPPAQIAQAAISTVRAVDNFYSVRAEGSPTGRFGAFIRLRPSPEP
jgi:copper oxidase (laccase) domain-containing protein